MDAESRLSITVDEMRGNDELAEVEETCRVADSERDERSETDRDWMQNLVNRSLTVDAFDAVRENSELA